VLLLLFVESAVAPPIEVNLAGGCREETQGEVHQKPCEVGAEDQYEVADQDEI